MRHKQRPIKSSRHKSVTLLHDSPKTSFEHNNVRHMNDVMRLAFLENNDITPETWKDIDFNSLSTATILKRNIQQQLQQQMREQEQQAKQQQQQQLLFQQQLLQQQRQLARSNRNRYELLDSSIFAADMRTGNQVVASHSRGHRRAHESEPAAIPYPTLLTRNIRQQLRQQVREHEQRAKQQQQEQQQQKQQQREQLLFQQQQQHQNQHRHQHTHSLSHNHDHQHEQQQQHHHQQEQHPADGGNKYELSDSDIFGTALPTAQPVPSHSGEYLCEEPDCGKSFPSLRKLRHHKVVHSDDFPFHCQFSGCEKKFKRKFGIDLHSTTHFDLDPEMYRKTSNNSSLPFFGRRMQYSMCKPCGQKFKTVLEYQHHMLNHGKEPFKCPVKGCGQTFSIWKSFQKHRASHYFNYYCQMDPRCEHFTSNLQLLKLHIYCCHFQRKLPENATLSSKDPAVPDGSPKSAASPSSQDLTIDEDPLIDDTLPEEDGDMDLPMEEEPSMEGTLPESDEMEMPIDDESLRDETLPDEVEDPIELAVNRKPRSRRAASNGLSTSVYREPGCDDSQEEFVDQMRVGSTSPQPMQSHTGEYLCEEPDCGKSFPSLRKLRHHKVVHSDDFPFHCQFSGCEKKFKRKFGIDLHSTTHFDLDPEMYRKTSNNSSLPFFGRRMQYSMCKPCGQKFKTVLEYQQHMLNHGKEPFKCPVKGCGQTFSIWKSFQKHRASHYFNYYCQMDPRCEHFTSNLQLLKLHIYCCHFQRKLPDNATLSSRDPVVEKGVPTKDTSLSELNVTTGDDTHQEEDTLEDSREEPSPRKNADESIENSQKSTPSTPRRDPRLRRNPPRSSTFGHQDYASISNGSSFAKITREMASPSAKRSRTSASSLNRTSEEASPKTPSKVLPRRSCATSVTPKKEDIKMQLKVLPRRSAQRMPMSLIAAADGESTEDDNASELGSSRNHSRNTNYGADSNGDNYEDGFRCHLCDYKFSVRFQLTKHLSTHLELVPGMYDATADTVVIRLSERRRREFFCDKCNVKFEQMSDLDNHMRKHGQRPYVCSFCQVPSTFRMAKQYLSHLYEHRFNYYCKMSPDCDFTINRKDALKLHIFRMHMNQKLPDYIENFASMVETNDWAGQQ